MAYSLWSVVRQAQGPFSREGTRCGPKGRWELGVAAGGGLGSQAQGARVAEAVRSGLGRNQASRQAQGATAHLPSKSPSAWGCLWVESSSSGPETHLGGRDQGGQPVSNWVKSLQLRLRLRRGYSSNVGLCLSAPLAVAKPEDDGGLIPCLEQNYI